MLFGDDTPVKRDVSQDVVLQAKMQALRVFVAALTGESPTITNYGDYLTVDFTDAQKVLIRRWIYDSLTSAPGVVRVDYLGLALPPMVQVYGKIALLLATVLFVAGRISKG